MTDLITPKFSLPLMADNCLSPDALFNQAIVIIDAILARTVVSISAGPPGSPVNGQVYIVGSSPSGAFVGHANELAIYFDGWIYRPAPTNIEFYNTADDIIYRKTSTVWVAVSIGAGSTNYVGTSTSSYAIGLGTFSLVTQAGLGFVHGTRVRAAVVGSDTDYVEGIVDSYVGTAMDLVVDRFHGTGTIANWTISIAGDPGLKGDPGAGIPTGGLAGQQLRKISNTDLDVEWVYEPYDVALYAPTIGDGAVMLTYVASRAINFTENMGGSQAVAGSAATATTNLTIKKNNSTVGVCRFTAGATAGVYIVSAFSIGVGDVLTVTGPPTADLTLAQVALTLSGTR